MAANYWHAFQQQRIGRRRLLSAAGAGGAALAAAALVGCGGSSGGSSSSGSTAASTDSQDGPLAASQALTVRYYSDPQGFDPATLFQYHVENIAFNVYNALTTYDANTNKIVPDLATSWEQPDTRTLNFKLVKNAKFHKGFGDLTSADVLYSYNRIIDPATASSYVNEFANVESVTAPDAYTVTIKLKQPDANFLHQVASYHQGQVVNRAAVEKFKDDYKFNPIGTGPFTFDSFTPSSQMVLSRNPDYFRGPATLEKITFRIIKDDTTAAIALQNGEVDLAMTIGMDAPLRQVMADNRLVMHTIEAPAVNLTIFNTTSQYLKDVRVRYAYAYAIDQNAITQTVSPLTGKVWYNLIPGWMDVYTPDVPHYDYDPAKAKAMMSAAGVSGFTINTPTQSVSESNQLTQSYLEKIGIKTNYRIVDSVGLNVVRLQGDFDVSGRALPGINPDTIFFGYLHPSNFPPNGLNGARYNNPELTKTLEAARAEQDFEKRKALYGQVQKTALTDLPYLPTGASTTYYPGFKYVANVKLNGLADVDYYPVKILAH